MSKAESDRVGQTQSDDYHRQFLSQKRLADALFGLFRTLGSTLNVELVAQVGLLTLTGQLLIKCAAFFERNKSGDFRILTVVGSRKPGLKNLLLPRTVPQLQSLFRERKLVEIDARKESGHPVLTRLDSLGFRSLFPLSKRNEVLGIIALGEKIVPAQLTPDDLQILDAFSVVMSLSLQNSLAYQLVETSRNELQRLNEMKVEFMSHVSHEFRTPLTILKNTVEVTVLDPEIAEMQRSALARLEHLVDSVLLFNEINTAEVKLDCLMVDAQKWVDDEVRPMLARHGTFSLESELPKCTLEFDTQKIRMAVECVVHNAVKFGSERGIAKVHVYLTSRLHAKARFDQDADTKALKTGLLRSPTTVDPNSPDSLLVIEVRDRGIGIPTDELDAVFQPFTQAANSPTRNIKGSGLGLTMAKRITEAHGGEVHCRSSVEQGTIIYIMIPAVRIS